MIHLSLPPRAPSEAPPEHCPCCGAPRAESGEPADTHCIYQCGAEYGRWRDHARHIWSVWAPVVERPSPSLAAVMAALVKRHKASEVATAFRDALTEAQRRTVCHVEGLYWADSLTEAIADALRESGQ